MKKLLVTGSSSFLGWNLCSQALQLFDVHGTAFKHLSNNSKITEHQLDITDFGAIDQLIEELQPDLLLHLAAYSKPDLCQNDPDTSQKVNVEASLHLARHAQNLNIPFAFTSTDLVFDGLQGNYSETDEPNPVSIYGEHKLLAEQLVMEAYPQSLICRCPLMYGKSETENQSYISALIDKMKKGEAVKLFADEYRSQALGSDVASGLIELLVQRNSGIYHLGGPVSISRYDFGVLVQDTFELPAAKMIAALQQDVRSIPPRPPDVSLNIAKAAGKGYKPKSPSEGLKLLKKIW